jgi:CubicO group peptidase (beta-lactamase class C family)
MSKGSSIFANSAEEESTTMSTAIEANLAAIDAYIVGRMQAEWLPGLALGIVHGKQIVHLRGFGVANPQGRPVTPQTPFVVGSLTKSFTALAIMQLVEAGELELDAPVQRYIPWFSLADPNATARIALRHLLNHTSGIPRYVGRALLAGKGEKTIEQRVRELSAVDLIGPAGATFQYSNANYLVLGLVIQIVSGQPYEKYLQQHILDPLEMGHSFLSEADARQDGMATGYRWWFGVPLPADLPYLPDALPAGFLLSSTEDMAHYLIAHLNGGQYGEASILSPAGVVELHRPEAPIGSAGAHYGMGWVSEEINGIAMLTHAGDTANYHADMILLPESQWGVIVLTNANNALVGQVAAVGKLGTWRIAAGVASLLIGRQPPTTKLNYRTYYLMLNSAIALISGLQIWSLVRLLRPRHQSRRRWPLTIIQRAIPLIWEVAAPLKLFRSLPKWSDAPWSILRLYAPDFSYWLALVMLPLSLITGALRVTLILLRLHHSK